MALNLTPEQQEIFDRVVGIVTQNDELRQRFKKANDELDKNSEGNKFGYVVDSDEPDAVEFRATNRAIDAEVLKIETNLKIDDTWLFHKICMAICNDFRHN